MLGSSRFSICPIQSSSPTLRGEVHPKTPRSRASSNESARAIDLKPEPSGFLLIWWLALHTLAVAAVVVLGAPWLLKGLALLCVLVHAIALPPERAPRIVYRSDGRIELPELGLDDLTLGPRTRYTASWVRFDLRGKERALLVLLLADQIAPEAWRRLQTALRRLRPSEGNDATAK